LEDHFEIKLLYAIKKGCSKYFEAGFVKNLLTFEGYQVNFILNEISIIIN